MTTHNDATYAKVRRWGRLLGITLFLLAALLPVHFAMSVIDTPPEARPIGDVIGSGAYHVIWVGVLLWCAVSVLGGRRTGLALLLLITLGSMWAIAALIILVAGLGYAGGTLLRLTQCIVVGVWVLAVVAGFWAWRGSSFTDAADDAQFDPSKK